MTVVTNPGVQNSAAKRGYVGGVHVDSVKTYATTATLYLGRAETDFVTALRLTESAVTAALSGFTISLSEGENVARWAGVGGGEAVGLKLHHVPGIELEPEHPFDIAKATPTTNLVLDVELSASTESDLRQRAERLVAELNRVGDHNLQVPFMKVVARSTFIPRASDTDPPAQIIDPALRLDRIPPLLPPLVLEVLRDTHSGPDPNPFDGPETAILGFQSDEDRHRQHRERRQRSQTDAMGQIILTGWMAGGLLEQVRRSDWPWHWNPDLTARRQMGWQEIESALFRDRAGVEASRIPDASKRIALANIDAALLYLREQFGEPMT